MLKENLHEEYGLLLSGQTEYILQEVYSGSIQKRSVDIQQYTRYAFSAQDCSAPMDGELICEACSSIRKPLRRLCRNQYE